MNERTIHSFSQTLENSLNNEQLSAALHTEGPLLVLAGAGTGKTKVLTSRIANILHQGIPAYCVLAVTFTNKAAREMKERINALVGHDASSLWLGTFHSVAAKILRRHAQLVGLESNFTILDTSDKQRLLKQIILDNNIDEKKWQAKRLAWIISSWKDKGLTADKITASENVDFSNNMAITLYKQYQKRLLQVNAVDFDDLLLHNLELFTKHDDILKHYHQQFQYILVDEYQDTNIAQYLWLRLLAQGHENLCCVGDDDQSIYGWRGAEVENILRFEKDYKNAKVVRLERNYRSTQTILSAASGLIANNADRLGKTLWTESNDGEPIKLVAIWDDGEEARYIADEIESHQRNNHPLKDIAILVRASFQTRSFEECFMTRNIPYKIVGGQRFYERLEIRNVIAYLRLVWQRNDDLAFERVINLPKRGIGPTTVQVIRSRSQHDEASMFNTTCTMLEEGAFKPAVAKALEQFTHYVKSWHQHCQSFSVPEITQKVIEESGYLSMWKQDTALEAQGRVENIKELLHALEEFSSLEEFLEHVSLVSDTDTIDDDNLVNVMTLHAAKGLEFETVFLPGWEEGLFPHQRSVDEKGSQGLEEERRLAYVGLTRAKQRAYISHTSSRRMYGQYQSNIPSRFIGEIPDSFIDKINMSNGLGFSGGFMPKQASNSVNASSSASPEGFKKGQRIFHSKFGYGKVTDVSADQLTIAFEKSGTKKIIDRFVEAC